MDARHSDNIQRSQIDEFVRFKLNNCRRKYEGFLNLTSVGFIDLPLLLHILLIAFKLEPFDVEERYEYLMDNRALVGDIKLAYTRHTFWELQNHPLLACLRKENAEITTELVPLVPISRSAFEQPYRGDLPRLFKEALDNYVESNSGPVNGGKVNNRSITVIQSSGMGKSRLVDEMGYLGFTIPINLGKRRRSNEITYSPPDEPLQDFFSNLETKSDQLLQAEFSVFLAVLFDFVALKVNEIGQGWTGVQLAVKWANYIKEGQNLKTVGAHRSELYENVIQVTRKVLRSVPVISDTSDGQRIISTRVRLITILGRTLEISSADTEQS
ncbi:hypothetical protein RSOLAG22IIIB_11368 [Rhizoctonia solani]|uniref:Uncharacterized protein n=1 Tax=Rhizoctonia solani TaxID=456999 RepID=A0A0K6G852_9AGAM|nr:hypothetical protein RSOLAG22IIIB_11368 [Rhizoctonia solani]